MNTRTVRTCVPAHKDACRIVLGRGNYEGVVRVVVNFCKAAVCDIGNDGVIYHILDVVLVSLPVCVEGKVASNGEDTVGVFLTVDAACIGNVEPTAEGVTVFGDVGGKCEHIADCEILCELTRKCAARKCYFVCGNLHSSPFAVDIGASYLDEVSAGLGEGDSSRRYVAYCDCSAAVNSYLVVVTTECGSPVNGAVSVREVAAECTVANRERLCESRGYAALDRSYFNGVILTVGKGETCCSGKIELSLSGCVGLSADLDFILVCTGVVPSDYKTVCGYSRRSSGCGLGSGCFGSVGRVVTLGYGSNLNGDLALE